MLAVSVAVEIRVEVVKVAAQSTKQRKQTEGHDWATLKVVVSGKKTPIVRSVSCWPRPPSHPPKRSRLVVHGVGTLDTAAEAVYANLQLMRF